MEIAIFTVIGFVSFVVGTFGFAQITGSIRCARIRGIAQTIITILIWAVILIACFLLVRKFFRQYSMALYIAYVISFILTSGTGRNGVE